MASYTKLRINLFINFGVDGWSETYYCVPPAAVSLTEAVNTVINPLIFNRASLLGANATGDGNPKIVGYRIEQFGAQAGASFPYESNVFGTAGGGYLSSGPCEDPWRGWLIHLRGEDTDGNQVKGNMILRGFPEAWMSEWRDSGVASKTTTTFRDKMMTFRNFLVGLGGGPKFQVKASRHGTTTNPNAKITTIAVTADAAANWIVTVDSGTWAQGDRIHVGKVKGCGTQGINRNQVVTNVTGSVLTLTGRQLCPATIDYKKGGIAYHPDAYALFPMVDFEYQRTVKRDTGRAFFATAGRHKRPA